MKKISGNIIDIFNRNIFPGEIQIEGSVIKSIEKVRNAGDNYILPGLVDSHIHIESSMLTPGSFAREAVKHGTVATVSDPHEIANVTGVTGIEFMIEDSAKVPLKFFFGAPSCVPATAFETNGAIINADDIKGLLSREEIRFLSEMMNYPGVIYEDDEVIKKIEAAQKAGKPVDGHAPGLKGSDLKKYIAAGISTDHECSSMAEALEKISLGMKILIREGSAARNLESLKELIRTNPDMVMLCSDDLHPEMLRERHLDKLVAALITDGFDMYDVLRAVTVNPARHYNLPVGMLKAGENADFIVVDDPRSMTVLQTWIDGKLVWSEGEVLFSYKHGSVINNFNCSKIGPEDISVRSNGSEIRVIQAMEGELLTEEVLWKHASGIVSAVPEEDILKIVVKDRYNDSQPAIGFIRGFGLKKGAFAGSVAHDSHNIVAVGTNDADIVSAVNEIVRMKGGLAACSGSEIKSLKLDIAGIISAEECGIVADSYQQLTSLVQSFGCAMMAPFMTLSFMSLLVIPALKIGDKGLFDVVSFKPVPLNKTAH